MGNNYAAFPYDFILKHVVWKSIVICLTVTWCVLAFASLPLTILLLSLLHIYRYTVGKTANFFRKDLGKMMSAPSSMVAASGVHCHPEETILLTFIVDGNPSTPAIRSFLADGLVYAKKGDNHKELAYPELQQYVSTYGGFYFWKWETNFDVDRHLKVYNETGVEAKEEDREGKSYQNPKGLLALRQKFLTTTFDTKISPWQFVVIRDYKEEGEETDEDGVRRQKTAVIFRIHHCLVDGYSLLKLIMTQFGGRTMEEIPMPDKPKVNHCRIIFKILQFVAVKTYQIFGAGKILFDRNDWHRYKPQSAYNCTVISPFPIQMIHDIKTRAGISFTSALLALVTGVVRKMMIRKQARLPKTLRLGYPFPRPGHPDKLRNHFTAAMIDLPVGTEDPVERLKKVEKRVLEIKKDLVTPWFFTGYSRIMGGIFHWILPPFSSHYLYTGGFTNFPGPRESISFCGSPALGADLCISIPRGNIAFGVGAISYMEKMYMSIQINKILVNEEEIKLLEKYVFEEIELLRTCSMERETPKSISIQIPDSLQTNSH